jgi:hypothetical protein
MNKELELEIKEYIKNNLSVEVFLNKEYNIETEINVIESVEVRLWLKGELVSVSYAT